MDQLRLTYAEQAVLLVTKDEIRYYVRDQPAAFFHPSMAAVRVKRLLSGETDPLLEASGVQLGDCVLDCTAGLASDSIVFSFAVGSCGQVTALESEQIPALLIQEGLASYDSRIDALNEAMRRIQVKHTEHLSYLHTLEPGSVDTVYFDPMFRRPITESSAISPLREVANGEEIASEAIEQAKRVARKSVILKELKHSKEFARLGFDRVLRSNTKTTYGVIRL
jgi:16S rRNA (guanine1516-N2)-methyltransferase